ncbi:CDP-alcohol phosphatidyltransferase family protein [Chloroflexota bacterium]
MVKLEKVRKTAADYFTRSAAKLLAKTPITPNSITLLGFILSIGAAVLVVNEHLFIAGWVVLIAGFFDMLDGALARLTDRETRFGAILDSTLDRLAEAALLLSVLVLFTRAQLVVESLLVGIALLSSIMVSYLRAIVEGIGIECKVGLFTRAERVVILALGLLLSQFDYALIIALVIIVLFSTLTVGQRLYCAWQGTRTD